MTRSRRGPAAADLTRHLLSQPGRALCGQEILHRGLGAGDPPHTFVVMGGKYTLTPDLYAAYCDKLGNKICAACSHLLALRLAP